MPEMRRLLCACGCGARFSQRTVRHKYATESCKRKVLNARWNRRPRAPRPPKDYTPDWRRWLEQQFAPMLGDKALNPILTRLLAQRKTEAA